jgi:hypothetical protein
MLPARPAALMALSPASRTAAARRWDTPKSASTTCKGKPSVRIPPAQTQQVLQPSTRHLQRLQRHHQHVGSSQVSVQDSQGVQVPQSGRHLLHDRKHESQGDAPLQESNTAPVHGLPGTGSAGHELVALYNTCKVPTEVCVPRSSTSRLPCSQYSITKRCCPSGWSLQTP